MRLSPVPVGPRGLALLAAAGLLGLVLAVHGWYARGSSAPPAAVSVNGHPATSAAGARASSPQHSARPAAGPHGASPSATPGPLLSTQSFAPYSFQVWPGKPSSAAQAAMAGLSISVRRDATGIVVFVAVNGQSSGAPHSYPGGAKVYVVEASLGDESGNTDYNLGDDGLVVTDAAGRILQ